MLILARLQIYCVAKQDRASQSCSEAVVALNPTHLLRWIMIVGRMDAFSQDKTVCHGEIMRSLPSARV